MKKSIVLVPIAVLLFSVLPIHSFCQTTMDGNYSYNNGNWNEVLILDDYDSTFIYYKGCRSLPHVPYVGGNWIVSDSILILNRNITQLPISESYSEEYADSLQFIVFLSPFDFYNLYVITESNDTLVFYSEQAMLKVKEKIKSFWVEGIESGKKTPIYIVKSAESNAFVVFFSTTRTFKKEEWLIIDSNKIQPLGEDGILQDYYLIKQDYYLIKEKIGEEEPLKMIY